jgi:anaerobic selenocysteine-containing dehydrogenase
VREKLAKKEFVASRTEGYEAAEKAVAWYTAERVAEITNVQTDVIVEAADCSRKARRASARITT